MTAMTFDIAGHPPPSPGTCHVTAATAQRCAGSRDDRRECCGPGADDQPLHPGMLIEIDAVAVGGLIPMVA